MTPGWKKAARASRLAAQAKEYDSAHNLAEEAARGFNAEVRPGAKFLYRPTDGRPPLMTRVELGAVTRKCSPVIDVTFCKGIHLADVTILLESPPPESDWN